MCTCILVLVNVHCILFVYNIICKLSTVFLSFTRAVMGVTVWPYIQYHDLLKKAVTLFSTHFPVFIQRAKAWWLFLKTLLGMPAYSIIHVHD